MIRKNFKKAAALALIFTTLIGSTAFATTSLTPNETNTAPKLKNSKVHKKGFKREAFNKLLKDLGLTGEDLKKAEESNKTIFDLAKEKGYSEKQVKEMLIKNKTDAINKAVEDGDLTREKADKIIEKVKEKTSNWDGSLKRPEKKDKIKTQ